ncbi:MAG: AAA family ATPase [Prevotella sp.]|nr:AAA family ATPase [Prevotella sp.]
MISTQHLSDIILSNFGHTPTQDQQHAVQVFLDFLTAERGMTAMILRGSAGTGKTSLVAAMVQTLVSLRQRVVLLAPTGRAAKVLALNSQHLATTIHRKIYRQKSLSDDFSLDVNLHTDTIFFVDEASMISTIPQMPTEGMPVFHGNGGGLIDDLITYVYSGRNCRMVLIGDSAQLPPVGEDEAPALRSYVLSSYGLDVLECDLNEVVRQEEASGILWNATRIRRLITHDSATELPRIRFKGFADIVSLSGSDLIDALAESYYKVGQDETVVITRSNKRANIYNNGIRARVLDQEDELCSGDRIMIVKNHYFENEASDKGKSDNTISGSGESNSVGNADSSTAQVNGNDDRGGMSFIANGDMAIVRRIRNERELYGFHFADLTLRFPDYDDVELDMTAILECLQSETPALTAEQQRKLYDGVMEDYADIPRKADRLKAMKKDIYYTALQIKFAYAVTCHKAQGGQWQHVYVDQGYMTDDMLTPDYIHWLYTAFTRATERLYLVNWSKEQTLDNEE